MERKMIKASVADAIKQAVIIETETQSYWETKKKRCRVLTLNLIYPRNKETGDFGQFALGP